MSCLLKNYVESLNNSACTFENSIDASPTPLDYFFCLNPLRDEIWTILDFLSINDLFVMMEVNVEWEMLVKIYFATSLKFRKTLHNCDAEPSPVKRESDCFITGAVQLKLQVKYLPLAIRLIAFYNTTPFQSITLSEGRSVEELQRCSNKTIPVLSMMDEIIQRSPQLTAIVLHSITSEDEILSVQPQIRSLVVKQSRFWALDVSANTLERINLDDVTGSEVRSLRFCNNGFPAQAREVSYKKMEALDKIFLSPRSNNNNNNNNAVALGQLPLQTLAVDFDLDGMVEECPAALLQTIAHLTQLQRLSLTCLNASDNTTLVVPSGVKEVILDNLFKLDTLHLADPDAVESLTLNGCRTYKWKRRCFESVQLPKVRSLPRNVSHLTLGVETDLSINDSSWVTACPGNALEGARVHFDSYAPMIENASLEQHVTLKGFCNLDKSLHLPEIHNVSVRYLERKGKRSMKITVEAGLKTFHFVNCSVATRMPMVASYDTHAASHGVSESLNLLCYFARHCVHMTALDVDALVAAAIARA